MVWKQRYSILITLFFGWLLCYVDRMVMASALPFIARDFHLSPLVMGSVLSAFFVGYTFMQIPGGVLADRFGPRVILTVSIGWWSVMTAVTGMVPGLTALLAVRVVFGLGEGPFPSAASKALSRWFPRQELGRANGMQLAAIAVGAMVAPLFVVALIENLGWRSVFYILFVPGAILMVVVWNLIRDAPTGLLESGDDATASHYGGTEARQPPRGSRLLQALRTPAVLWCALCAFLSNMLGWGLLNWLPTYLLQARGFGLRKMGILAALTSLALAIGYPLGGYLCDRYFSRNLRIPIVMGLLANGILTYLAARSSTGELAVGYLTLAFLVIGLSGTALATLPMLIVPQKAVGSAFGVLNAAGQLAGVFSPLLVGFVLQLTHGNFEVVLYCLVGICLTAVYPATRIRQQLACP